MHRLRMIQLWRTKMLSSASLILYLTSSCNTRRMARYESTCVCLTIKSQIYTFSAWHHVHHRNRFQLSKCQHLVAHSPYQSRRKLIYTYISPLRLYWLPLFDLQGRYHAFYSTPTLYTNALYESDITWTIKVIMLFLLNVSAQDNAQCRRMTSFRTLIRHIQFGLVTSHLDQPSRAMSNPLLITCKHAASWRFSHPLHRMHHHSCCGRYAKTLAFDVY